MNVKELFNSDNSSKENELINKAFLFAQKAHKGQKRASGEDFTCHVFAVAKTLAEMNLDCDTVVAGLLHDTLEDTVVSEKEILDGFGSDVLFLVKGATKIKGIEAKEKRHTSSRTIMKMLLATAEDIRVILIKLADRLHNLKTLNFLSPDKQKLISKESIEIYGPIAGRLNMGEVKRQIEDLAFPYAMPKEYARLIEETEGYFGERKNYIERAKPRVIKYIYENGINDFKIDYRAKHLFSLYQKLIKKEGGIELIYDLVAFRIIVPDVARCYEVLGVLHKRYRPLPGQIKDYIALPKPNGYQSLHTTVFCEEGNIVEFQIRTTQMHDHAENGIAAHWSYKDKMRNGRIKTDVAELAWVNKIKSWREHIQNPEEFFDALKLEIFSDRIFVFTPEGDIKDLPAGATPIDFAYSIHSDIGSRCSGAKINGKMVNLGYELQGGDVCQILISKNQKPKRDWLDIAKTAEARKKIRATLNKSAGIRPESI